MNLQHLKELEDHISTAGNCPYYQTLLQDFTFEGNTAWEGTTPLILACQHGELDSVKHIVESWGVDVCASAAFYSNPSEKSQLTIEVATPLFIAALYGHVKIVRYLTEKGAKVSARTFHMDSPFHGLTPLYGAVFDWKANLPNARPTLLELPEERSEIVRILLEYKADPNADCYSSSDGEPMWMERMCGIDATTTLVNHGLDLKRCNRRTGVTLLHYWASCPHDFTEEDSLTIIKLLVEKGANVLARDNDGFTPLLRAAYGSNDNGGLQTLNLSILDFLLERDEYSRIEKIEAMELAGAEILFEAENALQFPKAFDHWRRAHQLRQMEIEVSGPSAKKILGRKIGRHLEWTTLADLDQLEKHPEDYRIQALLVKLRIRSTCLGVRGHPPLSQEYLDSLSESSLDNEEKFNQIVDIRWGMLDVAICHWDQLSANKFVLLIDREVVQLVAALVVLNDNHPALLNLERIKTSLDLIAQAMNLPPFTVTNGENETNETSLLRFHGTHFTLSLILLLSMIFHLPEMPNEKETTSLTESLRLLGPRQLGDLLLPACQVLYNFKLKALVLVRVLLEAGADPNVGVDKLHKNASLHVVAGLSDRKLGDAAGRLLVEFGAKLHHVNKAGKTAVDIWIELNETEDKWNEEAGGWSARPEWCLPVRTLQCLAARVIRVHKIPYKDGITPATLHPLIELR